MSQPESSASTQELVRDAFERLLRGRLGRRAFIELVAQRGVSSVVAAAMAGTSAPAGATVQWPARIPKGGKLRGLGPICRSR